MIPYAPFDVIIIGGSYAGLSAAMSLGRSRRQVLIIDSGLPCNRFTPHSHNFLTQDGKAPAEIAQRAREQVHQYDTVHFVEGTANTVTQVDSFFVVETATGEAFTAKKLILANGIKDNLPDIPGLANAWGKTVIHCPYCHGYEFKDQKTGILAHGDRALHLAGLVHNLSKDLQLFTNGEAEFTAEQRTKLTKAGISIHEERIISVSEKEGIIDGIMLDTGVFMPLQALYAVIPFTQQGDVANALGCALTDAGHIKVDFMQKTSVPGVYACGDNSSPMRSVALAVSTGSTAGAMVNMELVTESF